MDKAQRNGQITQNILDYILMEKNQEKEDMNGLMEATMMENG